MKVKDLLSRLNIGIEVELIIDGVIVKGFNVYGSPYLGYSVHLIDVISADKIQIACFSPEK